MNALALSAIIFVLMLGGILAGSLLRRTLPEHHLDEHAKDVVRVGAGLIATITALVLGLLIASAKGSFDTQSSHIKRITADLILLDNVLQWSAEGRASFRQRTPRLRRPGSRASEPGRGVTGNHSAARRSIPLIFRRGGVSWC